MTRDDLHHSAHFGQFLHWKNTKCLELDELAQELGYSHKESWEIVDMIMPRHNSGTDELSEALARVRASSAQLGRTIEEWESKFGRNQGGGTEGGALADVLARVYERKGGPDTNTYQVTVLITIAHTLDVQVAGEDELDIGQAAADEVDELLDRIPVGLEYTTDVIDIQKVVDFP